MHRSWRALIIAILICSPALIKAQSTAEKVKVKVRISKDEDADAKLRPMAMVRSGDANLMMLRSGEFDVRAFGTLKSSLDLYDRTKLTYLRSQEPNMKTKDGKEVKVDALVNFSGRPILLGHNSTDGMATLYQQVLDPGLVGQGKPFEPLVSWEMKLKEKTAVVVSAGSAIRTPYLAVVSSDSSHMLVASPEIRDKETKQGLYLMAVVDRDLKVKWQRIVNVNAAARSSFIEDMEVDNAGNAYFALRSELEKDEAKGTDARMDLKFFVANAADVKDVKVKLGGEEYPVSAMLEHTADDRVVCAGVYGVESEKKWKVLGNFLAVFKAGSTESVNTEVIPFTGTGLEGESDDGEDTKAEAKDKGRMSLNTDVIAVLPRSDGSFFLVNEVAYVYTSTSTQGGQQVRYVHGPIQVRCLEKDGRERWSSLFRRWTVTGSPVIGPVFCAVYDDNLYLFLLDSEEMAERRKAGDKISSKHIRDPYSALVSFDAKGGFKVKPVLKGEKDNDFISGWSLVRTGSSEYFALGTEKVAGGRFLPVRIEFSKEATK
ncbi:MAG: hypothetical protein IPN38_04275 [Flavobacteriales bacterium]|nr:hypothetical protein [Flavobacteriales bacterium]